MATVEHKNKAKKQAGSGADARERIIEAARARFATVGFDGATTRQIAEAADVSQSLLLYHFGSKGGIWKAVMDDLFEHLHALQIKAARAGGHLPVDQQLMLGFRMFIRLCAEEPDLHRIITIEGRSENERLQWLVETHLRRVYNASCALIREGQKAGLIRKGDPSLLYYSAIAIAGTAYSLAPEIGLLKGDRAPPKAVDVEKIIRSVLLVDA